MTVRLIQLIRACALIAPLCAINAAFSQTPMKSDIPPPVSSWQQFEFERNGERITLTFRTPLAPLEQKSQLPYHVQLSYAYDKEGSNRLPNALEWERIRAYETAIKKSLQEHRQGVMVFAMGSDGLYQWNIYAKSGRETEVLLLSALPSEAKEREKTVVQLEFGSQLDINWSYAMQIEGLAMQLSSGATSSPKDPTSK